MNRYDEARRHYGLSEGVWTAFLLRWRAYLETSARQPDATAEAIVDAIAAERTLGEDDRSALLTIAQADIEAARRRRALDEQRALKRATIAQEKAKVAQKARQDERRRLLRRARWDAAIKAILARPGAPEPTDERVAEYLELGQNGWRTIQRWRADGDIP